MTVIADGKKKVYILLLSSVVFIVVGVFGAFLYHREKARPFPMNNVLNDPNACITSVSNNALIPRNLSVLSVEWSPISGARYAVEYVSANERSVYFTNHTHFALMPKYGFPARCSIRLFYHRDDRTYSGSSVTVISSSDNLDDSLVYRCVEPFFDPSKTGMVYIDNIAAGTRRILFSVHDTCTGCHAYSSTAAVINIRKRKDRRFMTVSKNGNVSLPGAGTFSYVSVSPDSKSVVLVLNATSTIEKFNRIEEPFNMLYEGGDLAVRGIQNDRILAKLSSPNSIYDMPVFSSDGTHIYFCRYSKGNFIPCISIFSADAALQHVTEILHSDAGEYAYFPRPSPDGRWLSYVSGDASKGVFARKTSRICIMDLTTRRRSVLECNAEGMNSWHTWSSTGSWIAFSTNRDPSRLTSIYLTHIDAKGQSSPPFKIAGFENMKANMPVFTSGWDSTPACNL